MVCAHNELISTQVPLQKAALHFSPFFVQAKGNGKDWEDEIELHVDG
jgi:hypothetical protein